MKVFLPPMKSELAHKFERLIDLALPESKAADADLSARWSPDFFGVSASHLWQGLPEADKEKFLAENSQAILTEALLIEHAGVAFGHSMALTAPTQQERHYYTCIASEELQHLRWLRPYSAWTESDGIPSFPQMLADLILSEKRGTLFLMIQILLEGWGIHYYTCLMQGTDHPGIKTVFANILFDESRHHAGGLLLFEATENKDWSQLRPKVQSLLDTLRIGPYRVALSLGTLCKCQNLSDWTEIFQSLNAAVVTTEKLHVLRKILAKAAPAEFIESLHWEPLIDVQMAEFLLSHLGNSENQNSVKDSNL